MSVLLPRLNATPLGHRSLSWCVPRHAPLVQFSTSAVSRQQPSSSRSSSSASTSSSPSSSSSGVPGPGEDAPLRWDPCLRLRKQRKMAGNITTIPTTILAFASSSSYFLTQEIDPTNTIAGIDPVYVNVVLTAGCTGLGYLIGPTVGIFFWNLYMSKLRGEIERMDAEFYEHIKRNRVDPSKQTMQNRLPDYYGENIGSISDYRRWLRDQAAFRRKAAHGVDDDEKMM